jgi:hypothetical protein
MQIGAGRLAEGRFAVSRGEKPIFTFRGFPSCSTRVEVALPFARERGTPLELWLSPVDEEVGPAIDAKRWVDRSYNPDVILLADATVMRVEKVEPGEVTRVVARVDVEETRRYFNMYELGAPAIAKPAELVKAKPVSPVGPKLADAASVKQEPSSATPQSAPYVHRRRCDDEDEEDE